MKYTQIAIALAALTTSVLAGQDNLDKRDDIVTEVQTAIETEWVYETVWVDANGNPEATSTPDAAVPSTAVAATQATPSDAAPASSDAAAPAPAPAPTEAAAPSAQSVYTPPVEQPTPAVTPAAAAPQPTTMATAASSAYTAPAAEPPAPSAPAVEPSSAPAPAPAPSSAAPAAPAAPPASSGGGESYQGKATFYDVGLGSCGDTNVASDMIVAIAPQFMKQSCGKMINISAGGKTATAKVMDTCPSCDAGHLDMSRGLFGKLTDDNFDLGVLQGLTWSFAS